MSLAPSHYSYLSLRASLGVDRAVPGLLLFRAETALHLDNEKFIDAVWPTIKEANASAEGFSQISRDVVVVLPADVDCPITDKSSIKRGQVRYYTWMSDLITDVDQIYRDFEKEIEDVYLRLESTHDGLMLSLSIPELESWVLENFAKININIVDAEADFFTSGVDSLKAIQMRGMIVNQLDLGSKICGGMIVYDCGNTRKLAKKLYVMRELGSNNEVDEDASEIATMTEMIAKYSKFEQPVRTASRSTKKSKKDNVVVSFIQSLNRATLTFADSHRSDRLPREPYSSSSVSRFSRHENHLSHSSRQD